MIIILFIIIIILLAKIYLVGIGIVCMTLCHNVLKVFSTFTPNIINNDKYFAASG